MKSAKEILAILVNDLINHLDKIRFINHKPEYYNKMLGDSSSALARLLELLLKKNYSDWDQKKWIDDSLLTNALMEYDKLKIEGIMIWGKENTTEQWTDPFYFEIELLKGETNFKEFTFLFCDLDNPEISYEEFRDKRNYWEGTNRNWKYIINSNVALI